MKKTVNALDVRVLAVNWKRSDFCGLALPFAIVGLVVNFAAADLVYNVVPVTLGLGVGDPYDISGTITTNGTLGLLEPSDIVDYEIAVSGTNPYNFAPSNSAANFGFLGTQIVEATSTDILLGDLSVLFFSANDNSLSDCTDCVQRVGWGKVQTPFDGVVEYRDYIFSDRFDHDPDVLGSLVEPFSVVAHVVNCDFNSDGSCNIEDIDGLIMEIAAMTNDSTFDLNADGLLDVKDRDLWLQAAGAINLPSGNPYLVADFNLDGFVDGFDFIQWNGNKFSQTGKWSLGDANADGFTDGFDFIEWNTNKFMSSDGVSAVPEPSISVLLIAGLMSLAFVRRH